MGNYCTHFSNYQALDIEQRTLFFKDKQFDLDLWTSYSVHALNQVWEVSSKGIKGYKDQQFDLDLCPCDFKQGALIL